MEWPDHDPRWRDVQVRDADPTSGGDGFDVPACLYPVGSGRCTRRIHIDCIHIATASGYVTGVLTTATLTG